MRLDNWMMVKMMTKRGFLLVLMMDWWLAVSWWQHLLMIQMESWMVHWKLEDGEVETVLLLGMVTVLLVI